MNDVRIELSHPSNAAAQILLSELSQALATITGDSGEKSFSTSDADHARAVFLVAYSGDQPVGCGCLRPLAGNVCELKRMYARIQNRGIGGTLLRALEMHAIRLQYDEIWLETRKVNTTAVSFYLRNGYVQIPNYGKYVGNERAICFGKATSLCEDCAVKDATSLEG